MADYAQALNAPVYVKTDTLLKVDHVWVRYGDKVVLRDVCADVQNIVRSDCIQGQVVCFLGPSGIGKTQLSRVIAGLQQPSAGGVYFFDGQHVLDPGVPAGKEYAGMQAVRRGTVGMVPQTFPLFEFATVRENLRIAGKRGGLTTAQADAKAREMIAAFGLGAYMDAYPQMLSGGTCQRVAIVRQLMVDRHFFVFDEPFSGLDPIMKRKAAELLAAVANRDELNTLIVVTHDITEGLSIADMVWMLGREQGQPGATIVQTFDMAAMDLCWHPDLIQDQRFQAFVAEVKGRFTSLAGEC